MSDPTTTTAVSPDYSRSFFGHPRGLATLFMTEFFERFTYYGMRAMLVLFLAASATGANPGFGVDGATAGAVYALFTGAAYLCCIPGGWIADRLHRPAQRGVHGAACSSPSAISSWRFPPRRRSSTSASRSSCSASAC